MFKEFHSFVSESFKFNFEKESQQKIINLRIL